MAVSPGDIWKNSLQTLGFCRFVQAEKELYSNLPVWQFEQNRAVRSQRSKINVKLSVLMPVFNEKGTLDDILDRIVAAPLPGDMTMEIVCVDDCSTDGSWDILQARAAKDPRIRPFKQAKNQGKGAAIRAAVQHADGDIALIQDADLEYNPADYKRMLIPFLEHGADVVYGSRFTPTEYRRILFFWPFGWDRGQLCGG